MSFSLAIQADLVPRDQVRDSDFYQCFGCAYILDVQEGGWPCLRFLLLKDGMRLPSQDDLARLLHLFDVSVADEWHLDGFYLDKHVAYSFVNVTNSLQVRALDESSHDCPFLFALVDEICVSKHVCGRPVDETTTLFFLMNPKAHTLVNERGKELTFDHPVALYVGKPTEQSAKYMVAFGCDHPRTRDALMGGFYYFTSFRSAVLQGTWTPNGLPEKIHGIWITDPAGMYLKGCVVRTAVHLGRTKYCREGDCPDYAGTWAQSELYTDSVVVGSNLKKEDGSPWVEHGPLTVVKRASQCLPLSYHVIDTVFSKNGDLRVLL